MDKLNATEIRNDDAIKDILILGGSVISTGYLNLEPRLDTLLKQKYGNNAKFAFYNIAAPAHTALDNAMKYDLLDKHHFDLVIYYEAINDTHANNIPPADFKDDYSHIKWYDDIYLLGAHPEINITVIPYLIDKTIHYLSDKVNHKIYLSQYGVDQKFIQYGAQVQSERAYEMNVGRIIAKSRSKGEKLLLLSYASHFPPNIALTGDKKDLKYYAKCNFATPVTMWGSPESVRKGVNRHNEILRRLAQTNSVAFMDMEKRFPADSSLFCDVCHLSEAGARQFARELAAFLIDEKMLE
ncbi:hypothetical protein [Dyadobacter sp. CY347]|uniref:hypothetical protein n=1 Tax=Dyadobacter sp. CY347 TaxID=2909336 RepID=UPI001F3E4DF7|nr:hypothetical protein [Dyadobacter sp. CY347]MCF2490827.1 hypothetical protein [Dyadobacter sp. CY347]